MIGVLAGGVPVLKLREDFDAGPEGFFGASLVFVAITQRIAGIEIIRAKLFAVINPERVGYLCSAFRSCSHGFIPFDFRRFR